MFRKIRRAGVSGSLVLASMMPISVLANDDTIGALYTMSNAAEGNSVLMYNRDQVGKLTPAGEFYTDGLGTGTGLGNQGAVILDPANRWLFVVNAGSDDVSVMAIDDDSLVLVDRAHSGGQRPISLTYSHNVLYVLNAGGAVGGVDSISGFHVGADGNLAPIAGSTRALSETDTGPAQISFNNDGDILVVTEKATNLIDTFIVDANGVAGPVITHVSAGVTPFGFAVGKRDQVLVSEAAGGAEDQSSLSSYSLAKDGSLTLVSGAVPTTETAACWAVVSNDGRYIYTTNAGSGSVSGYEVGFDGALSLLDADGRTGITGKGTGPLDMVISNDGRNLYTLNGRSDTIGAFAIKDKGGLASMNSHVTVPATANGLAIR
jgi:6-phosphogluconolactonase (cycloisomerase 2 family)